LSRTAWSWCSCPCTSADQSKQTRANRAEQSMAWHPEHATHAASRNKGCGRRARADTCVQRILSVEYTTEHSTADIEEIQLSGSRPGRGQDTYAWILRPG
jgi:hypothetical protein